MRKLNRIDIILVIVILGLEVYFFRNVIFSDNLLGNCGDGRLTALITEHWFQFVQGKESVSEVAGAFYPIRDVLSYSDIFLLVGILHSVFRIFGLYIFSAYKYSLILIHCIGSLVLYYYFRKKQITQVVALLGTAFFSYSHVYLLFMSGTQMIVVSLLPIGLVLMDRFFERKEERIKPLNQVLFAVFFAVLFYTAFYVGYLASLQFGVYIIVYIFILLIMDKEAVKKYFNRIKECLVFIIIFIITMIPFFMLYVPLLKESGGRDYRELSVMDISDVFYYPLRNLDNSSEELLKNGYAVVEDVSTYSLLFTILVVLIVVVALVVKDKNSERNRKVVLIALSLSCLMLFVVGVSFEGESLWKIVFKIVPGASAVRVQSRWLLIIQLPVCVLLTFSIQHIIDSVRIKSMLVNIIGIVLIAVFLIENYNPGGVPSLWNEKEAKTFIEYVATPPNDCKVFYIKNADPNVGSRALGREWLGDDIKFQYDAMEIATIYGLKTFNGMSGMVPPGWEMDAKKGDNTDEMAREWANQNGVDDDGVYAYDMSNNKWEKVLWQ